MAAGLESCSAIHSRRTHGPVQGPGGCRTCLGTRDSKLCSEQTPDSLPDPCPPSLPHQGRRTHTVPQHSAAPYHPARRRSRTRSCPGTDGPATPATPATVPGTQWVFREHCLLISRSPWVTNAGISSFGIPRGGPGFQFCWRHRDRVRVGSSCRCLAPSLSRAALLAGPFTPLPPIGWVVSAAMYIRWAQPCGRNSSSIHN